MAVGRLAIPRDIDIGSFYYAESNGSPKLFTK